MPKKELTFDQIILEKTNKWAARQGYKGYKIETTKKPKSKQVKAIEDFLSKQNFDGRAKQVAELFSIVFDEPIQVKSNNCFEPFTMVVPIVNFGSHNYPLNKPTLIVTGAMGIRTDGSIGNNLPTGKENIRPATEVEIKEFISNIKI